MKRINVYHTRLYDFENDRFVIGGIETYLLNLFNIFKEQGFKVQLFQFSKEDKIVVYEDIKIIGVSTKNIRTLYKKKNKLVNDSLKHTSPDDIFLYSTHSLLTNHNFQKKISIQHGITFDIVNYQETSSVKIFKSSIKRFFQGLNTIRNIKKTKTLIAVDYNFLNWYRTMPFYKPIDIYVVPNFTKTLKREKVERRSEEIKIIFSRRFQKYRGTRIFALAIEKLLQTHDNIRVTLAGEGPDEPYLRKVFSKNHNVSFINYPYDKSLDIHAQYDIAVVPTIGSEGTSLSLLEAMSAGCAVIATNVGGMTNVILDGFNGLLINPKEEELYEAIVRLIEDRKLRQELSDNAQETVSSAFNYKKWHKSWVDILNKLLLEEDHAS